MECKAYPRDVSDDEWALVAPYLTLIAGEAPQRDHSLREVFNGLRWMVRAGAAWRMMPHDLPPWHTVYQQRQRWLKAGVFDAIVHDLRELLRVAQWRHAQPSAAIFDSRTLQSTPESGTRADYDGATRRRGSEPPDGGLGITHFRSQTACFHAHGAYARNRANANINRDGGALSAFRRERW
jgi:transposase